MTPNRIDELTTTWQRMQTTRQLPREAQVRIELYLRYIDQLLRRRHAPNLVLERSFARGGFWNLE